jgi:hypothetical protein
MTNRRAARPAGSAQPMPKPVPSTTRTGIRFGDDEELSNLYQGFDELYLIGSVHGPDGTIWYALPKGAPDEYLTERSAADLREVMIRDHWARQERRRKAGRDGVKRMST